MPNVFITGAAGFIGGYCVREFIDNGWHVFALVHRKSSANLDELAASGKVTIIQGDLNQFSGIERDLIAAIKDRGGGLDAIVHSAGRASDVGWRSEFRRTNYESVVQLGGLSMRLGCGRFVFVSTTDVYGLRDFNGETETELPLHTSIRNPYPEFKIAAERWLCENLPADMYSIIRPAAVWGAGDPTLTPRVVGFLRSSPWIIHFGKWRGNNRWPLAHVRNVAAATYLAACDPEAAGTAINVLDDEVTSVDEFYRKIASVYLPGKAMHSVTLPLWIGQVMGAAISGISNLLNLNHPFTDPSLYALYSVSFNLDFSNQAFKRLLDRAGRRPFTLQEGLGLISENQAIEPRSPE